MFLAYCFGIVCSFEVLLKTVKLASSRSVPDFHDGIPCCIMDSAEWENLRSTFINQGQLMNKQQCLHATKEKLIQLANVLSQVFLPHFKQTHSVTTSCLTAQPDKLAGEAAQY